MKEAKKVFYNTGFLYAKVIFSLLLALYSTRILLAALGEESFGVFNLIAGIILMLSFLNGAMTVTTQRYLSFNIGKNNIKKSKEIFSTSISLHLLIAFIIVVFLELFYFFLFDGWLNIPKETINEAKIIYQFMVVSTFFTVTAVPYDSAINAHEDLLFDSVLGILESIAKLCIAIVIMNLDNKKLVVYGLLIAVLTILIRVVKTFWCTWKYEECKRGLKLKPNRILVKEMYHYAAWNLFGSLCYIGSTQGLALILNRFFGVSMNATYAIAYQINSQMQSFSVMLVKAFNPQIVKSEGGGDRARMIKLASQSSKFSSFLVLIMIIPLVMEMPFILKVWLVNVPPYAIIFCSIVLISTLIRQLSSGLKIAVQAVGDIKRYQSFVGISVLLTLPLAYILLKFGMPPYGVVLAALIIELFSFWLRLNIVSKKTGISQKRFINDIVLKLILIGAISSICALFPHLWIEPGFLRLIFTAAISTILTGFFIWKIGFDSSEKHLLVKMIKGITNKIKLSN